MTQLLQRIELLLKIECDAIKRAQLIARKGIYLARIGRFDEARAITVELRATFGAGQSARVTIWLMLLEGVYLLYQDINPAAIDRVRRAQFLSLAIKDKDLICITSAWKAHLEFEGSDFPAMTASLLIAIENSATNSHDGLARLSMVMADALFLCGDRKRAQYWFMRSRSHAIDAGDQATTEALLYNRAAFGTAWLRSEQCFAAVNSRDIGLIRLEVSSARNFQEMTKISAFGHLIALCDARLLIIESKFEEAMFALKAVRDSGPFAKYNFDQDLIDLELAYCLQMIGRTEDALQAFGRIKGNDLSGLDVDDRLVSSWLRSALCSSNQRFGDAVLGLCQLEALRDEYRKSRVAIQTLLTQVSDD